MEFVQTWIEFFMNNNGGMIFGAIGVALAIIYLGLKENSGSNGGGSTGSGDPLGDILNDY